MKVIITGTSGMVGKGVLLECLDSEFIEHILIINRRSIGLDHPKLKELLVSDFFNLDDIKPEFGGFDACFFCLGTSSIGKSEKEYAKITYDLTINFAETFLRQNKDSNFCYVSGAGTDSTEKGRFMWARVKGRTENKLLSMSFKSAFMFRPGYIQPLRGIKSSTNWYSIIFYAVFSPVYLVLKHFPSTATNTVNMGKAMIRVMLGAPDINILENKQINLLAT